MPSRIYSVFISSSFDDLKCERGLAIDAVMRMSWIPCCMEHFPATGFPPWRLIRENILRSDFYVIIVGGRYGSIAEGGISFTEKELTLAEEAGVPILAFIHSDPSALAYRDSELGLGSRARLDNLRKHLFNRYSVSKWDSKESLGAALMQSLSRAAELHHRPGWVRAEAGLKQNAAKRATPGVCGIKIVVDRAAAAKTLMPQLRGLMKQGPGRGGEIRLVLPLEDRGREVEIVLPGRYEMSPQVVNRIGVLDGVREVIDL